jgi:porphobilinogen synthase
MRKTAPLRRLVAENSLLVDDLILPVFVVPGQEVRREVPGMPGIYHFSADRLVEEAKALVDLGITTVLMFGLPGDKDPLAQAAYAANGVVQRAVRALKSAVPELVVVTDVCVCEYTGHGHCGILKNGYLHNDASLQVLTKVAVSHAEAGADIVAPAAMLDGQVGAIRAALDEKGHTDLPIMSYSAKYASKLYDPFFNSLANAAISFGDKRSHQMDFRNGDEAMREISRDIDEGADIVLVKPALFYLDIVRRAKTEFRMPLAVYNVSGEYAMIKAAAAAGKLDETQVVIEALTSCKRAGADIIVTYHAKDIARQLARA